MNGRHAIIECYGEQSRMSADALVGLMQTAAREAGATVLESHIHKFGEGAGNTGVVMLAESHITVHTWPEHNYAAFDIFMCGDHANLQAAIEVITASDPASDCSVRILERGAQL